MSEVSELDEQRLDALAEQLLETGEWCDLIMHIGSRLQARGDALSAVNHPKSSAVREVGDYLSQLPDLLCFWQSEDLLFNNEKPK